MAKISSILFLLAFGWYSIGYILQAKLEIRLLKREMRATINQGKFKSDKLVTLVFTPEDLADPLKGPERVDAHEIRVAGKMYDVVRESTKNGVVYITCIPDKDEDSLLAAYIKLIKENHHGGKKSPNNSRFSFGQFLVVQKIGLEPCYRPGDVLIFPFEGPLLQDGYLNAYAPPPWLHA